MSFDPSSRIFFFYLEYGWIGWCYNCPYVATGKADENYRTLSANMLKPQSKFNSSYYKICCKRKIPLGHQIEKADEQEDLEPAGHILEGNRCHRGVKTQEVDNLVDDR